ncbi:Uncharacterized protein NEOC95_001185 [Neochlamydia sp. AcF95]|nr:Uncharacterized protein [Neochlamydia sp. AcF95]
MYRFKRSFRGNLPSRKLSYQREELYAKSLGANKMAKIGMHKERWMLA